MFEGHIPIHKLMTAKTPNQYDINTTREKKTNQQECSIVCA